MSTRRCTYMNATHGSTLRHATLAAHTRNLFLCFIPIKPLKSITEPRMAMLDLHSESTEIAETRAVTASKLDFVGT